MKDSITNNRFKGLIIFLFWITVWEILYLIVDNGIYLPSPIAVIYELCKLMIDKATYITILASIYRTLLGILLSVIIGIAFGLLCGLNKFMYDLFNPLIIVIRSTPIVSIIIFAILIFKSTNVPIFAGFLMCFPVIFTSTVSGIKNTDIKLLQMAKLYNISKIDIIKSIYLKSSRPYILSGIISSLGIAWKATSAAEVLSMPKYSIGKNLFYAKVQLEPASLFAWTIIIIILSFIFEKFLTRTLNYDRVK